MSARSLKFVKEITIKFNPWNYSSKQPRIVLAQITACLAKDPALKTDLKVDSNYKTEPPVVSAVLSNNTKLNFDCTKISASTLLAQLNKEALALDTSQ